MQDGCRQSMSVRPSQASSCCYRYFYHLLSSQVRIDACRTNFEYACLTFLRSKPYSLRSLGSFAEVLARARAGRGRGALLHPPRAARHRGAGAARLRAADRPDRGGEGRACPPEGCLGRRRSLRARSRGSSSAPAHSCAPAALAWEGWACSPWKCGSTRPCMVSVVRSVYSRLRP